ncbi:glycoside hydrolase family 43 protein [Marinococcus luteus]|uniref:glycoside hydrolase family 43 protein n=1 Tax=Marinococcus luteus TaxID=1122204 RepID=UPI002ACC6E88|nr:glycoside hydrolase family 43 protein [Marinococcus luteus]MDZ5781640.1 glycoside hydrolase family 43 protein [Marinococcus luteus]
MNDQITNPILTGFNPDPSICRAGENYYIATSTFEWFPGVQIHHSKDLKNWEVVKHPLERISQLNMAGNPDSGGVWAPALSWHDNQFWLIYSDIKQIDGIWKDGHNYLVTCDTIDGEWSDPVYLNSSGFDPSLYHDDDGRKYLLNMVWDYRPGNHRFYGIALQEYDAKAEKLIGERQIIFTGTDIKLTEGPHIYKVNGWYYLLTAEGGTTFDHAATIARSKSLFGPYEVHPENPFITSWPYPRNPLQKAGHGSLVETQNGDWYFVHLTGRPLKEEQKPLLDPRGFCPLGRETAIQKVYWEKDWPYIAGGNEPSLYVEGPGLSEEPQQSASPVYSHFNTGNLDKSFQTLRIPLEENTLSLKDRPGYLRLYGKDSLTSKFTQAFVARRWQHFYFDAETAIQFDPDHFQQSAGMVCYYNTQNWVYFYITHDESKGRILTLLTNDHYQFDTPLGDSDIEVDHNVETIYLKVSVRMDKYWFSYSFDGSTWTTVDISFPSAKLSDDHIQGDGFFTGAFVGMQCQDSFSSKPADFEYFHYAPKEENDA